ncbi:LOW QUALITY PROTEIN: zona pellucida sperm-binding protein 3-like [Geospiza fortis]|uniref:LOW QUALITY PROTEIN: zona pellucida sperm-binding protein 3-like n=1 Tax=Geospiza fortis TaxID=48883 RepID=A0A6I9ZDK9_GEOFO|nr:LOW QUALITY PROTEIN: zona pellucida sperm-binding protein 3-like [Geospiza fortis]
MRSHIRLLLALLCAAPAASAPPPWEPVTPDSLIYRTLLSYDPSPGSNPAIVRSDPAVIPIECHYPRRDNVSSGSIRPTWAPFNSALASQEKLLFSLRLMNEDWSAERDLSAFRLGDVLNIQAEVGAHSHVPPRVFGDALGSGGHPGDGELSLSHYAIIDFNGGHRYRRHAGDGATSEADVVIGPVLLSSAQRGQRPEGQQGECLR